ncbi:hypothetical protein HNY73_001571 [Argiope bruennichi]|uniref:ISXO2-like transposase domain-containing protein n=1 Tax=Argiope bruennichi TaxID=94029 RepID=A0A8T0G5B2_ARGBR|nr:hypothetical protein HNY73_001571 [Argiope bruennichi]
MQLTVEWIYGASHTYIVDDLCVAKQTATDWMMFCREVCTQWITLNSAPIGGEAVVVEIDESKFGKRKFNRGKRVEGQWVFGGIEKCFMEALPDRSKETLLGVLKKYVLPSSVVVSDCWKACDCHDDEGFRHFTVNHSVTFRNPVVTPTK